MLHSIKTEMFWAEGVDIYQAVKFRTKAIGQCNLFKVREGQMQFDQVALS